LFIWGREREAYGRHATEKRRESMSLENFNKPSDRSRGHIPQMGRAEEQKMGTGDWQGRGIGTGGQTEKNSQGRDARRPGGAKRQSLGAQKRGRVNYGIF